MKKSDIESMNSAELQNTWSKFLTDKNQQLRNALIVYYQYLVTETVKRLPNYVISYWENEELKSFGQDGLVRAIMRWDGPEISKFENYARRCIRGAVFDELRRLDWMPRSTRQRVVTYRNTYDRMLAEFGRTPKPLEVCNAMGLNDKQARTLLSHVGSSQLLHLEGKSGNQPTSEETLMDLVVDEGNEPETLIMSLADSAALAAAIATLGEREQKVLHLSFAGGLTQGEIGKVLGVGGPRVCKIQRSALEKLRAILTQSAYIRAEGTSTTRHALSYHVFSAKQDAVALAFQSA
jgi:RNA polymerase sigma factor for flagellar operon FliA